MLSEFLKEKYKSDNLFSVCYKHIAGVYVKEILYNKQTFMNNLYFYSLNLIKVRKKLSNKLKNV